jgi:hypothetical protein
MQLFAIWKCLLENKDDLTNANTMKFMTMGAVFVLALAVCCSGQAIRHGPTGTLSFSEIKKRRLSEPVYAFTGLVVSPEGAD